MVKAGNHWTNKGTCSCDQCKSEHIPNSFTAVYLILLWLLPETGRVAQDLAGSSSDFWTLPMVLWLEIELEGGDFWKDLSVVEGADFLR